ncbi:phage major capsid family protein [Bacillus chungangensis]|uniref:HK97 family phage major capsid protein n=1 Tax=Bacillus chungangensis TaxID=587633 RepID=A0ABT9WU30_9BACI|nr:phage major capsid protein [Bacillus chungangensis]MDQ0176720.1 HK97 family phage major capsid protein [Bacillus chungangensis]
MAKTNQEILKTITTGDLKSPGAGYLNPYQADKFLRMAYEATPFNKLHRKVKRTQKKGEIDKIAIGGRLLRKKTENTDDGYRADVQTAKIEYSTVPIRLPWEITEETLRENIEGENFEDVVMEMMTTQFGIDIEDLHWNGDTDSSDPFISINDGWRKKILAPGSGAHLIDMNASPYHGVGFGKTVLFGAVNALPNKYRGQNLRWLMSPLNRMKYIEYMTHRATGAGDNALLAAGAQVNTPLGYEIVEIPQMPDDMIVLSDPQNFIAVNTYDIRIRKTTEGREAIMEDKRFYVVHVDDDVIIQEMDAIAVIKNVDTSQLETV